MTDWWGKLWYWFAHGVVWAAAKLLLRLRVEGARNVPSKGGLLIASNHLSNLDPPLIGVAVSRMVFHIAKTELFRIGFLLWFMRTIGTIEIKRGRAGPALEEAQRYLQRGAAVVIFPEGTRSTTGHLGRGHSGAILLAIRSKCQIQPAAIVGSEQALRKGSARVRCAPVSIRFGEPYRIAYDGDTEEIPRSLLRVEVKRLMERIEALLPEHMHADPQQKQIWYRNRTPG